MKKIKFLIISIIIITIVFGGSGCMSISEISSFRSDKGRIIEYLSDKYNDKFVVDESISAGIDVQFNEYHCHSEKNSDSVFVVYEYKSGECKDNYFGVLIQQDFEALIKKHIEEYYTDYKLYFNFKSNYFDDYMVNPLQLSDYIQKNPDQFGANISIFLNESNVLDEVLFREMCSSLSEDLIDFNISVAICSNEDYENIDEFNFGGIRTIKEFRESIKGA